MKNEINELLKNECEISEELQDLSIKNQVNLVKKIGKQTDTVKSDEIRKDLNTGYIGKNLYIYNEVTSTNTVAKFLAQNGVENGSVVISKKQSAGKGRSGKFWESPLGGIWLSIILTPEVDPSKLPFITLTTGVAVSRTLEKIGIKNSEIKWPNDIIINGKKVCGILTETVTRFNNIENVIIGVGIDANVNIDNLPCELQKTTTTLENELGMSVDENFLIKIFFGEFEKIFELFDSEKYEEILKQWRKRSYTIGKMVEIKKPFNKPYNAYVLGISKEGALVVEKNNGELEKVFSGECIIKN